MKDSLSPPLSTDASPSYASSKEPGVVVEVKETDAVSQTSSVCYNHEPFEDFRKIVLDFAQTFWNEQSPANIKITRLKGGGYNRIIGISRKLLDQDKEEEFILRIPRFDAADLARDVAALRFVQSLETIPVPSVVSFNGTSDNKLGHPYMIQKRIPGISLHEAFKTLPIELKMRVAVELGGVYRRMLSATIPMAGDFVLTPATGTARGTTNEVTITPFYESDISSPEEGSASTTVHLLRSIFEARAYDTLQDDSNSMATELIYKFGQMASEMDANDLFDNIDFTICHRDLLPRNILILKEPSNAESIITAILDWDSAVSAPCFMACVPPIWLWAWRDNEDEDERTANDMPSTEECCTLKKTFERAAGLKYIRYAYQPAYRLARRLCRFALDGVKSDEDYASALEMLDEWKDLM